MNLGKELLTSHKLILTFFGPWMIYIKNQNLFRSLLNKRPKQRKKEIANRFFSNT